MKPIDHWGKSGDARINLDANQLTTIQGRHGTSVLCLHGQVWVTQEGDARDYIVPRGLRYVAPGRGRIVVNGVAQHSRIEVAHVTCAKGGGWAQQPLQIEMRCFAQIESEARLARSTYCASQMDALVSRIQQICQHAVRWLEGLITATGRRKPGGNA